MTKEKQMEVGSLNFILSLYLLIHFHQTSQLKNYLNNLCTNRNCMDALYTIGDETPQ